MFLGSLFIIGGLIGLASAGFELMLKPASYGDHNMGCRNNGQMGFGLIAGVVLLLFGLVQFEALGHLRWLEVACWTFAAH